MSKLCPKCGLGSDDKAVLCRWCGGDLCAEDGVGGLPAGAVPPTGPCPPSPPGSGFPLPPTPGLPPPASGLSPPPASGLSPPPASGLSPPPASGFSPPPASGFSPPPAPGYPPASGGAPCYGFGNLPPSIPTHLVWAILSTIICCNPLGIVSIVYAAQVNTLLFRADIPAAQRSSRLARNWAIATIAVSVVGWIIYGIAVAVFGLGVLGRLHS